MYIALVMSPEGKPSPVWENEDCDEMKTWDDIASARADTQKMPIAVAREIIILDTDYGQ